MNWSLTVPKQDNWPSFEEAVYDAKESPKADGRTKAGKAQTAQVAAAKNTLIELSAMTGATAGSASGHVSPDLSGNVSVSVTISAP